MIKTNRALDYYLALRRTLTLKEIKCLIPTESCLSFEEKKSLLSYIETTERQLKELEEKKS